MNVKKLNIAELGRILNVVTAGKCDYCFDNIVTDSRSLTFQKNILFVAISGITNDGHQFVKEMYHKGVRAFMVEIGKINFSDFPEAGFLICKNSVETLQKLASIHRENFSLPVIGITGSNGKTIVKEWLFQLLNENYTICRSPRSYNSQLGVPLSVLQLDNKDNLAIFEAGISHPGEMEKLEKMIRPTIGVFTGIGSAHDQGFQNQLEKTQEKLKLFTSCEKTIINCLNFSLTKDASHSSFLKISKDDTAFLKFIDTEQENNACVINAVFKGEKTSVRIPFSDKASIQNALTCWATLLALGVEQKTIAKKMETLQPIEMRLELKQGIFNSSLINDAYNSDLLSLSVAIDFLNRQKQHDKKIIILSDIHQSGKDKSELYSQVAAMIDSSKPFLFIGIGEGILSHKHLFEASSEFYHNTEAFLARHQIQSLLKFSNSAILLKGARIFEFEKIKRLLQQKSHDTRLEINLNSLRNNLIFYRKKLRASTKIMAMVKATSYGSGSHEIASVLEYNGTDYLAVAYADEGVELRKAGIKLPIMVMSPEPDAMEDIVDFNLEPELFSFRSLALLLEAIKNKALNNTIPIHIKLDTGMRRLGFCEAEVDELIETLNKNKLVEIKSVFSHLVASDDPSFDPFTRQQIKLFESLANKIAEKTKSKPLFHICNSSAIHRFPEAHFNMVRLGIGLYGIGSTEKEQNELIPISSLKTKISQIKKLKAGDTVGYNRKGIIKQDSEIATLPIGYADGFSRKLGNEKGIVWINGKPCKVIGNVCMDMTMVDVTGMNVKEGDDVVVFENAEQIKQMADTMDSIPYEVLTSVSSRVKRIYVQE